MRLAEQTRIRVAICIVLVVLFLTANRTVNSHAILKESSPAANSSVMGPDVPVTLKFNVRIDAARSKLKLQRPDNSLTNLVIETQASPEILATKATGLKPGAYKVEWQVLASDGHITQGLVPFSVSGY
jgi:methionine-rich copper-binding protein CopC